MDMSSYSRYWPLHFPGWISRRFPTSVSRFERLHVVRGRSHHLGRMAAIGGRLQPSAFQWVWQLALVPMRVVLVRDPTGSRCEVLRTGASWSHRSGGDRFQGCGVAPPRTAEIG